MYMSLHPPRPSFVSEKFFISHTFLPSGKVIAFLCERSQELLIVIKEKYNKTTTLEL
jgi:hypothetical protein